MNEKFCLFRFFIDIRQEFLYTERNGKGKGDIFYGIHPSE